MFSYIFYICSIVTFLRFNQDVLCSTIDDFLPVEFLLMSKVNPKPSLLMLFEKPEPLKEPYKATRETKIIIHDWNTGIRSASAWSTMQEHLQSPKEYNVIMVDWHHMAMLPYPVAEKLTEKIGKYVGRLLEYLINFGGTKPADIEVIAYGLGTHIAAYAGRYVNGTIGRITAIEPFKNNTNENTNTTDGTKTANCTFKSTDAKSVNITSFMEDPCDIDSAENVFFSPKTEKEITTEVSAEQKQENQGKDYKKAGLSAIQNKI